MFTVTHFIWDLDKTSIGGKTSSGVVASLYLKMCSTENCRKSRSLDDNHSSQPHHNHNLPGGFSCARFAPPTLGATQQANASPVSARTRTRDKIFNQATRSFKSWTKLITNDLLTVISNSMLKGEHLRFQTMDTSSADLVVGRTKRRPMTRASYVSAFPLLRAIDVIRISVICIMMFLPVGNARNGRNIFGICQ